MHILRTQLKTIQERERELTQIVIEQIQRRRLAQVDNCTSRAVLVTSERLNINPQTLKKKVSRKDFMGSMFIV